MQLFIKWTQDETVKWYSTYQLDKVTGKVYDYRVSKDGEMIKK